MANDMNYTKIQTILGPGQLVNDAQLLVTPGLFSKSRRGVSFRPSIIDTTTYVFILPYDVSEGTPTVSDTLQNAKYVIKGGQEALDYGFGPNIGYSICCDTGQATFITVQQYL